jgi:hypothetical protein
VREEGTKIVDGTADELYRVVGHPLVRCADAVQVDTCVRRERAGGRRDDPSLGFVVGPHKYGAARLDASAQ